MLVPHILAGAALATVMPTSAAGKMGAFSIGVVSHYLLDALPHWERLFNPHYNDRLPHDHLLWPNHILIQGALDTFIGLLLLRYFAFTVPVPNAVCIFFGGIGAALPDIIDNTPWWKNMTKRVPLWRAVEKLHRNVHMSYPKQRQLPHFVGLLSQLVTAGISVAVLLRFKG